MSETNKTSVWIWISLGLIIGLFVVFIIFLDQNIVNNGRQETPVASDKLISNKPVFDFYKVLPEREMKIPESSVANPNESGVRAQKNPVKGNFIVQAGSFQKLQDAERHKVELTLKGFEPVIKTAEVKGATFYRIELGPFTENEYSKVQRSLIEHDIVYFAKRL
ncbi:MAG: SPOR domain-containing protein [Gammaproteobacteria bacterium]|nr:SPOR domain-containing protein [Gammaproteobacteria bacterium]MBL7000880.1 SPOR domain-containing protein [Gammaproteobacteria bacterium]